MSEQSTPDQSSYGRPYVDYYPYSGIPPRRGGYTVREPHGSEAASATKWESTTAREGATSKPVGGSKEHEVKQEGGNGEEMASDKVVVEVTAADPVAAPREPESQIQRGPVCIPPGDS
ncbi:hypothetical protein PG996_005331 [Apiospora saccharicola]|uniref:Uncharacterized protein n=1 Tax=Apiospora saccharicola TaxID=335842 RepID=A0ABR1VL52_9PEZI